MKKILIIGVIAVIVAVATFVVNQADEPALTEQKISEQNSLNASGEAVKSEGSNSTPQDSDERIEEVEAGVMVVDDSPLTDSEKYCEQLAASPEITEYREVSLETYKKVYSQVGDSTYEKLPLESVKSYADNGEASAMWHYGVEVMWKEALGSYRNPVNQEKPFTQEELWEVLKKHDPNFEMFNHGKEYAFRAAIQGRVGAILETANMETFLARQIKIREGRDKDAINVLASAVAHIRLMEYIHRNDPSVIANMGFEERIKNKISTAYNYEEFMENEEFTQQLNNKVKQLLPELERQWKEHRLQQNLPIHLDLFDDELEAAFIKYAAECLQR